MKEYQVQSTQEGFKDLSMEEQAKALAEDALVMDCALMGVSLPEEDNEEMNTLIVSLNKRDNLEDDIKKYIMEFIMEIIEFIYLWISFFIKQIIAKCYIRQILD